MALSASSHAQPKGATGVLVLGDGTVIWGKGFGASGHAVGEVCFNTAMTGYQEVMTDPSYDSQIVTFTFPHIGNVGANEEDHESRGLGAVGLVVRQEITPHSSFRAQNEFVEWCVTHGKIGLSGVDTRALTRRIRMSGAPNAVIAHNPHGEFDLKALKKQAEEWGGLEGLDLVPGVTREGQEHWTGGHWQLGFGYGEGNADKPHVVAIDYGAKDNIFRNLVKAGAKVTVVPAKTSFDEIMALEPDGVFLSNGPGDPDPCDYAIATIREFLATEIPVFGICLGLQLLGLAAGLKTKKMGHGHHGANHPVKNLDDGTVLITSQNHGFCIDEATLNNSVRMTHRSLFDGTLQGLHLVEKPAFGFQGHPEASPGPHDASPLFDHFIELMQAREDA